MWTACVISLLIARGPAVDGAREGPPLFVHEGLGDDSAGNGTQEAPFRSLTRALAELRSRPESAHSIRLGHGSYGAFEAFPLRLPPGCRIEGVSSALVEIQVPAGTNAFEVPMDPCAVQLSGLSVLYARVGVLFLPPTSVPNSPPRAALRLADVHFDQVDTAVDATGAGSTALGASLELEIVDCRFERAMVAVRGRVDLACDVTLRRSSFRGGETGIHWSGAASDAPAALRLEQCEFLDQELQAVELRLDSRPGDGLIVSDCRFSRSDYGLRLESGSADGRWAVRGCRFMENRIAGIQAAGRRRTEGPAAVVEDSVFLWNGTGIRLVEPGRNVLVQRTEIGHCIQDGLTAINSLVRGARLEVVSTLVHHCAGRALFVQSEAQRMDVSLAFCTLARSGTAAHRRDKGEGHTQFRAYACVFENDAGPVLSGIAEEELRSCWVHPPASTPVFRDPVGGDFRLFDPAASVEALAEQALATRDLLGRVRDRRRPSPGALERDS